MTVTRLTARRVLVAGASLTLLGVVAPVAHASPTADLGWTAQYVAQAKAADDYSLLSTYIDVGLSGQVKILYARGPNTQLGFDLRLARGPIADGSFRTESIDPKDKLITGLPSMAVDSRGRPSVSYVSGVYADRCYLKYATKTAAGWKVEVPDPTMPVGLTSIAVDSQEKPIIAYTKANPANELRVATRGAASWTTSHVSNERVVALDVVVDASDHPEIGYVAWDGANYVARIARYDGTTWSFETIGHVASQGIEFGIDLKIDTSGTEHLVYPVLEPRQGMVFAESTGSGWKTGYIATGNLWQPSQAIDPSGTASATYYNATIGALIYATQSVSGWVKQKVADNPSQYIRVGRLSSLTFDAEGAAHVAYYVGNAFKGTTLHYAVSMPS